MESTTGGTRRHLRDVARVQREAGHEVTVVASCLRMPEVVQDLAELERCGVRTIELPMVRSIQPATDWRHLRALQGILREHRPEVIHTHSSKAGVLGRTASMRTGIGARVHTPHTFAFLFAAMFGRGKRALIRGIETRLGRSTHRLVAVGSGEAETIRASGVIDPEIVRVVPNGIDPAPFAAARAVPRKDLGVPQGVPLLATVGLLNVAKGQDLAIEALALEPARKVHLLLVGHGEEEPALRALSERLGVIERVHFLGWRADVPELLAAADACLLPSRWEGLPYIVLEAMAARRPVLAAAVDGARDLVEEDLTGFLFEPGDTAAMAEQIGRFQLMTDVQRVSMGSAGAERIASRYDLEAMRRGLDVVYAEAMEATR